MFLDFLVAYPSLGNLFWSLTPKEFVVFMDAAAERVRREHNDRMILAWNIAALPGSKTRLKDLLLGEPRRNRETPEQRLAAAASWAALFNKR